MHGRLFTLVNTENQNEVYAWGIEITDGDETEAAIYRRDPASRLPTFGLHASAEAARALYSRAVRRALANGLTVVWWDDPWEELAQLADPDPEPALT